MRYRTRYAEVEAITFDELVEHGRTCAVSFGADGMPWAFDYKGHPITQEHNELYLLPFQYGSRFYRGDMLVSDGDRLYALSGEAFAALCEPMP